jgi:hypothetical protein
MTYALYAAAVIGAIIGFIASALTRLSADEYDCEIDMTQLEGDLRNEVCDINFQRRA